MMRYIILLFNIYIKHVDSTSLYSVRKESGLNETGKDRLAVTGTGCGEEVMGKDQKDTVIVLWKVVQLFKVSKSAEIERNKEFLRQE